MPCASASMTGMTRDCSPGIICTNWDHITKPNGRPISAHSGATTKQGDRYSCAVGGYCRVLRARNDYVGNCNSGNCRSWKCLLSLDGCDSGPWSSDLQNDRARLILVHPR